MTRIITYSLALEAGASDNYYRSITMLADRWLAELTRDEDICQIVARFRDFQQLTGRAVRSDPEYRFELLALGVLLREHGEAAAAMPNWFKRLLTLIVAAQKRWPKWELAAKWLRGRIGEVGRRLWGKRAGTLELPNLIAWLRANGESAQARRLAQWQGYFDAAGPQAAGQVIAQCAALAEDFAQLSQAALGAYTAGVDKFLQETAPKYRGRYDAEFVSRSRLEHHLGLLGTEILNRAYRARFLATGQKMVIVPPCMRAQPDEKCKAVETPFGAKCQACTPTCRVHQVTRLGEKHGFDVYMIPDELRAIRAEVGQASKALGLVGVSCALTNWSGGWDADSLGIPAQGVLLDYVGCQYHWDEDGIPTNVNFKKLLEVVGTQREQETAHVQRRPACISSAKTSTSFLPK